MNLIKRIKESLKRGYYCDCRNKDHWQYQPSILGLVGSYIGCAIMLGGVGESDYANEEKKYCELCHP